MGMVLGRLSAFTVVQNGDMVLEQIGKQSGEGLSLSPDRRHRESTEENGLRH